MLLEAIYHQPNQNWAYGYNETTILVRIRTKRNDVDVVEVIFGDKCTSWSRMQTASM
ncbi:Cyclomaltodextrinase [compost metagenome]